jgi:hypothetical protein
MPRLPHAMVTTWDEFRSARNVLSARSADIPLGFAVVRPVDTQDFGFLFPELQDDSANLLPEARETRDNLISLGKTMRDTDAAADDGDSEIPSAYTYFGQFVDHDITLETTSANLQELLVPDLAPLSLDKIEEEIRNGRTATLDLDSVYGLPAPRDSQSPRKMKIGQVTKLNGAGKPLLRPLEKDDDNDLPREPRSVDFTHDRAALTGDPRNDENTIIAQLHLAFLKAHNRLIDQGKTFREARISLRLHYQHIILHDFLKRIADPQIVDDIIDNGNRVYDPDEEHFFMPLEFSVAAYRFGHSMVRAAYDFNLNFNTSGEQSTIPADLGLLFTFTALSGELGNFDTLPENWIIEWKNFVDVGAPFNKARLIDTKLVEPLFELTNLLGQRRHGDRARLAVRNLLRGYLLRMPTGQAVARALQLHVLTSDEIKQGAVSDDQVQALQTGGFLERTPLWYYILVEVAILVEGRHLGPVGSTIVAEVLVGLARRSPNSILARKDWQPTLPSQEPGTFTLTDLLRFAGVLEN